MANKDGWEDISEATLTAEQAKAYAEYKAKYREAKALRQVFEGTMQEGCPTGHKIICGYNFGKLSVKLALDDGKAKAAPARPKMSLAQYLALQR